MQATATDRHTIYLSTAGTRKVHMEMGFQPGRPSCDRNETIDNRLGQLPEIGGQDETITILTELKIAPSRLCGHCFSRRLVSIYGRRVLAERSAA